MKKLLPLMMTLASVALVSAFNLDRAIIPKNEIVSGGPPKDGIPAILHPKFIRPQMVDFLGPDDQVIGVRIGEEARAYPLKILNWHEAVNDSIQGLPILVTF
jgi:hypothetical protein